MAENTPTQDQIDTTPNNSELDKERKAAEKKELSDKMNTEINELIADLKNVKIDQNDTIDTFNGLYNFHIIENATKTASNAVIGSTKTISNKGILQFFITNPGVVFSGYELYKENGDWKTSDGNIVEEDSIQEDILGVIKSAENITVVKSMHCDKYGTPDKINDEVKEGDIVHCFAYNASDKVITVLGIKTVKKIAELELLIPGNEEFPPLKAKFFFA